MAYRSISTNSPYGKLAFYRTPYPFPLPTNNRPQAPAANSQVVSSAMSPQSKAGKGTLGQSATGHRHGGWLRGYVNPYPFPLPWQPSGMGDYVSTAPPAAPVVAAPAPNNDKLLLGAVALGAAAWFIWKKKKL